MKSLPSRAYGAVGCQGSNHIRSAASSGASEIRSSPVYAGHAIKPLKKPWVSPRAPAVLDRNRDHPAEPKDPCPPPPKQWLSFLSSNPSGCPERNGLLSFRVFGMRAQTGQQPPARPEARCLTGLYPLAKRKIYTYWTPAFCIERSKTTPINFLCRFCHTGTACLVLARRRFSCGV